MPPDVLIECGYAEALGLRIYGVVDELVDQPQQGLLRFSSTNYPRYNKNQLEKRRTDYRNYANGILQDLGPSLSLPYEYEEIVKDVTVCNDGYGVIRLQYKVLLKEDQPQFKGVHKIGFGSSAKKGLVFPSLAEMGKNFEDGRKSRKPLFGYRVIQGDIPEKNITLRRSK